MAIALSGVSKLLRIAREKERGPIPSFTEPHLILAILFTGDSKLIGRQALARKVGLGEGAVRTILKRLKEDGYVDTIASGCYLTKKGTLAYKVLQRTIPRITQLDSTGFTVGKNQVAVLLRTRPTKLVYGVEQRDSAIKAGAAGATTYIIKDSKFQLPGGSKDCEKDFPSPVWKTLRTKLQPLSGDILIVCGSDNEATSRLGAISAAMTLVN
jgi:biotin operon repressor